MRTIEIKGSVLAGNRTVRVRRATSMVRNLYPYQSDIVRDHLLLYSHTLTEAPTGSGKSTIMLGFAARKIGDGRKIVIITPKLGINSGFVKYTAGGGFVVGGLKLPAGSVVEARGSKSKDVCAWLRRPFGGVLVCSYASFIGALGSKDKQVREALGNTVLLVDEVHHSAIDEVHGSGRQLGGIVSWALESCAEIHVFTATAFRSDGSLLVNGDFVRFRRTLREHYIGGYCPDFGVFVRFYQKVGKAKFDKLSESRKIGSSRALIAAYVDEYDCNRLPTLMLVDTARQAKDLYDALLAEFDLNVVNLGSEDGETYEATKPRIKKKYKRLDSEERIDVVIAVKVFDEGVDWPDCAQTFSSRVSGSLVLLMQRAIGRAMRLKRKGHSSPQKSRVVLFEVGIKEDDRGLVAGSLFELAVRLKALCEGLDFTDEFRLRLPERAREKAEEEKKCVGIELSQLIKNEIQQELYEAASRGSSAKDLVVLCTELYEEEGVELSGIAALELVLQMKVVDIGKELEEDVSKWAARKLTEKLVGLRFSELIEDEWFRELMGRAVVNGVADYVSLLGAKGSMAEIGEWLRDYLQSSSAKNKEQLLKMAKNGKKRPNSTSKDPEEKRLGSALIHYTNKSSGSCDAEFDVRIRQLAPKWFEDTAAKNKEQLLEMAKGGKKRPSNNSKDLEEKRLGIALINYTCKSSGSCDAEFDVRIRKLASKWFEDTAAKNKEQLLEMAKNGKKRPSNNSKDLEEKRLGSALSHYTCKVSGSYDTEFNAKIRKLRLDWFEDTAARNKEQLLEMAKGGKKRPSNNSKDLEEKRLGSALSHYTCKVSGSYDTEFNAKIRKLRLDWFEDTAARNKEQLLKMAKGGKKRPSSHSKDLEEKRLGSALVCYTGKSRDTYDAEFNAKIRKLRLDWFEDTAARNKEQLLKMAKGGKKRPSSHSKDLEEKRLGSALVCYTGKLSDTYDAEFNAKIRKLRLDWFEDTAARNKEQLLEMAKGGKKRPSNNSKDLEEKRLGSALSHYTCKVSGSYDGVFDVRIRKLASKWFEDTAAKNKGQLLEMARSGEKRPSSHSKDPEEKRLGSALVHYTCKSSGTYDAEFDVKIRKLRPGWFGRGK